MHLTLHLTRACNLRCSYCYSPPRPGPAMTLETARQVLRFGAHSTGGSCGIVLFGGEPLLCKDLIREVVAEARAMTRRGEGLFHFKMTTNGLLLDDAFLEFAVENDILVAMSIDGVAEAHDRHRRLPDGSPTGLARLCSARATRCSSTSTTTPRIPWFPSWKKAWPPILAVPGERPREARVGQVADLAGARTGWQSAPGPR